MKEVIINGTEYNNVKQIHQLFAKEFDWNHYGHNLDALWDFLTTEVERPFLIKCKNNSKAEAQIGKDYISILNLLKEVEQWDKENFAEGKRFILIVE